jgi:hypothetical protein
VRVLVTTKVRAIDVKVKLAQKCMKVAKKNALRDESKAATRRDAVGVRRALSMHILYLQVKESECTAVRL